MINNIENIRNRFDDRIGGINGNIYAAEPLIHGRNSESELLQYQRGVEVFAVDGKEYWLANGNNDTIPYLHRLMYQRSSIHNSAVNIISSLIYGAGLEFYPLDEYMARDKNGQYVLFEKKYNEIEAADMVKGARVFAKNTNLQGYSRDAGMQIPIYGGYYGIRDYSMNLRAKTQLRSLRVEKYFNMRLGADREWKDNRFQSSRHFISNDWTRAVGNKPLPFSQMKNDSGNIKGKIYYIPTDDGMMIQRNETGIRSYFSGRITDYRDFYATPIYESLDALSYIDIDYMLSQKDYRDLQNGFSLEHIIVRYRKRFENDDEERKEKEKEKTMFKSYKGFDAENTMMLWVAPAVTDDGKVETPDTVKIITIPNDNNSERYNVLREERNIKILSAHNIIAPELIGMNPSPGNGLSSQSEYLITAMEQLHWSVVSPYQKYIIDDIQDMLFNSGIYVGVRFKSNAVNYQRASDEILKYAYSLDEIRAKKGDVAMSDEVAQEVVSRIEKQNNNTQNQR